MGGQIFNLQSDGVLLEMREEPFHSEDVFQALLENYPNLLAGDQLNANSPIRWLLVKREMGVASETNAADRWSLDHLFIDQDGIPTLVEVKRSSDTRIRREVVGQMLDYAANAVVHWSVDRIQAEFVNSCERAGMDPDLRLAEFLAGEMNADEFWQKTKTNLQAGKIRMLFVADVIPDELKRIIEFLNEQMDPAQVLGIEIKHYVGQGLKTLVPRVIGQTAEAESRKAPGNPTQTLSREGLQAIADERGVGTLYASLVGKLSPLFDKATTTKSTITFYSKVPGFKSGAAVVSLTPEISSASRGIRFGIYADHIARLIGVDRQTVSAALPECDLNPPNYGGGYCAGFASRDFGLDALICLIKESRIACPNN